MKKSGFICSRKSNWPNSMSAVVGKVSAGCSAARGPNLADMHRIGIPVPPGFIVTTEACNAYLSAGGIFPEGMWEQELQALKSVEQSTGKTFGDSGNPLLVSCRSGAKFSMPGMMDTVLNIGLNDVTGA